MKLLRFTALLGLIPVLSGQSSNSSTATGSNTVFTGPSILSSDIGTIGKRSGSDVDLRFFANADGIYDTGLAPYAIDSNGILAKPEGQFGVEAGLGLYGRHRFHRSVFGVDYTGNFRHYAKSSNYDGTNQALGLEYTVQKSRRLLFDMRADAITETFGTVFGNSLSPDVSFNDGLLFDNRTTSLSGQLHAHYLLSNRTVVTVGGRGDAVRRRAQGLADVNGYLMDGSIRHQLGRDTVVGGSYQHIHYDFPHSFGESDIDNFQVGVTRGFQRTWSISLNVGVYHSQVQGVQSTALDPILSALLGIGSVDTVFYRTSTLPSVEAKLTRQFRRSMADVWYERSINPGNGVYLTSRSERYGGSYAYTGLRRASFSIAAETHTLDALAQSLERYHLVTASAQATYRLGWGLNAAASYFRRLQNIANDVYSQNSSRVSFGIYFSPGEFPVSFH